jgi:hypothetical protein
MRHALPALVCVLLAGCSAGAIDGFVGPDAPGGAPDGRTPPPDAPDAPGHAIRTVFVVLMENHNWSAISGSSSAPYINGMLLPMGAHATNYFNPRGVHPSLPNYLWLEAGQDFGISNDSGPRTNHQATHAHLARLLDETGISWRSYQEDIAGDRCPIDGVKNYAPKHNPFVYFDDETGGLALDDPGCIAHNRPLSELAGDLAAGAVARYNFITPNLCHDMHDSCAPTSNAILQGDTFLAGLVPEILAAPSYQDGGALFILWDEASSGDGPIPAILLSPSGKVGYTGSVSYTHSSTVRTLEEIFDVAPLLGDDAAATTHDLSDLFERFP